MEECDRWTNATCSRAVSRNIGVACGRWPTGCSGRQARRTTPCRRPGSASTAPALAASRTWAGGSPRSSGGCLNMLRSRRSRREQFLGEPLGETSGARMPDPIVDSEDGIDPEHQALLADGIGLAMLAVLDPDV